MELYPASNRHFTVTTHEVFTCFRSVASISQRVYQVGRKVEFARSCPLFLASFGKLRLSDQVQFIAWHGIQRRIIWIFCRESEVSGYFDLKTVHSQLNLSTEADGIIQPVPIPWD